MQNISRYIKIFIAINFFTGILWPADNAYALEPLFFGENKSPTLQIDIKHLLSGNSYDFPSDYIIAETELNGDYLPEYILKEKNCDSADYSCRFLVIGQNKNKLTVLTQIQASNLVIPNAKNYGVRDILAFQNPENDYDYKRYIWSPELSHYTVKGEELLNQ